MMVFLGGGTGVAVGVGVAVSSAPHAIPITALARNASAVIVRVFIYLSFLKNQVINAAKIPKPISPTMPEMNTATTAIGMLSSGTPRIINPIGTPIIAPPRSAGEYRCKNHNCYFFNHGHSKSSFDFVYSIFTIYYMRHQHKSRKDEMELKQYDTKSEHDADCTGEEYTQGTINFIKSGEDELKCEVHFRRCARCTFTMVSWGGAMHIKSLPFDEVLRPVYEAAVLTFKDLARPTSPPAN